MQLRWQHRCSRPHLRHLCPLSRACFHVRLLRQPFGACFEPASSTGAISQAAHMYNTHNNHKRKPRRRRIHAGGFAQRAHARGTRWMWHLPGRFNRKFRPYEGRPVSSAFGLLSRMLRRVSKGAPRSYSCAGRATRPNKANKRLNGRFERFICINYHPIYRQDRNLPSRLHTVELYPFSGLRCVPGTFYDIGAAPLQLPVERRARLREGCTHK